MCVKPQVIKKNLSTILEGDLGNISKIIVVDILITPWVMESIQIGEECYPIKKSTYTTLFKGLCDIFFLVI